MTKSWELYWQGGNSGQVEFKVAGSNQGISGKKRSTHQFISFLLYSITEGSKLNISKLEYINTFDLKEPGSTPTHTQLIPVQWY